MKIKILSKFGYQKMPLDKTAIEVNEEDLQQIGITKCFDVKKNKIISYDKENDPDYIKQQKINRINELKQLLNESDYRTIKFIDGCYTVEEYYPYKQQRQAWRDEINELEKDL